MRLEIEKMKGYSLIDLLGWGSYSSKDGEMVVLSGFFFSLPHLVFVILAL